LIIFILPASGLAQGGDTLPPPQPPVIDYVSVDTATGYIYVTWGPSPSEDIERYIIYYVEVIGGDSAGYPQGEVGKDTLEFLWATSKAGEGATTMTVASTREGFDPSPLAAFHTTIFLSIRYDSCEKTMELDWTPYQGWGDDLVRYDVYASVDNGTYSLIDQTDNDVYNTVHNNIEDNRQYCYFLKAIRNDGVASFSNVACREVRHPLHPQWIDAEQASAVGEDQVSMDFYIEESGEVTSFQLFRASGPGKPFIEHEIITDVSGPTLNYTDNVVSTDKQYQYKLYSLDVCYNPVISSNITGNIVLLANSVALQAFLSWTPYLEYEAGVKNYHIYRITNMGEPELINVVDAPDTSYTDNLDFVTGSDIEDEICYYVRAEENDGVSRGEKGFSQSNTTCISVTPKILMANAFTPNDDGRNDIIKPVLTFIPEKYVYQVFDRWGSRIFETTDPETGWDGSVNGGGKASEGVYIYYILLTTTKGIEVEQRGEITLFYP
jgi:gliding motility-associated-like protein